MGHGSSKHSSPDSDTSNGGAPASGSFRVRFRRRLSRHLHRRDGGSGGRRRMSGSGGGSEERRLSSEDDFAGIALISIVSAEMKFKDKWLACITLGQQTFRTEISDHTSKPVWKSEKKLLLERNGPHVARISVYETNRLRRNHLVGFCEIDLLEFLVRESTSEVETVELLDPSSNVVVGNVNISLAIEDPVETEKHFARRILAIVDYNEDGILSYDEFSDLVDAFGNQLAAGKKEELFKTADENGDGVVTVDELAALLTSQNEMEPLINRCPVCGEKLHASDKLNNMIHMTLCFGEGTGNQIMTGGFLTDKQAAYGWMFKLSEWAHFSSYDYGLNCGSNASRILVFDRKSKRIVEELIDQKIILAMRAIYQSKVGLGMLGKGAKEILQSLSEKQGRQMSTPESVNDIPKFIKFFKDQINMSEVKHPMDHFKTFNDFFIRELKPNARPIACLEREDVAVCGADCRLMAFKSVEDSTRFWIKGRKFSIKGLLGNDIDSSPFDNGTVVIFRLAPQDYHRFHVPVSGVVEQFVHIPGCLYTVRYYDN
uniref:Phosphatidylserine decarboxylase n=1 Tax=Kalanchoe fedtschenkoi TaxID=63787 RepID=A0A7N0RFY1_KALFE